MYKNSVQRFREIVKIMAYYGFGYLVDKGLKNGKKSPANLRKAFEELGPTFIKIGQILSTRTDILPAEYIEELTKLQDNVPPESFEDINSVFLADFSKGVDELFLEFDKTPLASASIAQVHRAVLHDGREVIVKVQRPHIYEKMKMDISILHRILGITKVKFKDALIDPKEALEEISLSTEKELDFELEAKNIERFASLNKDIDFLYIPFVVREMCFKNIVTMEKIDGIKITDIPRLHEEKVELNALGRNLALSFFKQIFEDGFFHGDPHPGNILVVGNKLCFIDFGIMGEISPSLKDALNEIFIATAYEDINKLISVLMSIGIRKGFVDRNRLYEDIDYLMSNYLSTSLRNIKVSVVLEDVFDVSGRNNIKMPKELTLLVKTMVIVEGVVSKISPDINLLDVAIPYVKASTRKSWLKDISLEEVILKAFRFSNDSSKIPSKLLELSDSIIRGRARVQLEHKNIDKPLHSLNRMINRLAASLLIASMIIGSSLIIDSNAGSRVYGMSLLGLLGFIVSGIASLWLLISIIRSGKM
ncbi:MAG: AarF/ABC1/UbiB kinase family protein [Bacillota bacterium]|nr:AarF/ABC1/UbiB kinase family protein [Bacillota bacterium]